MREAMTISLPAGLRREMQQAAADSGVSASEFVRDAIQRKLWLDAFDATRRKVVPKARAAGIYTDEDVFKLVS